MAAGNAVFTEVLQIGIDTSVFAAQMKQVEQIYANSIKNMPQLGQMGTQIASGAFQKAAKDISDAAQSIETNVITMSQSVQNAMSKMATNAQSAGAATAAGAKAAVSGVSEHVSTMERFGNALETAFIRIPARMAAIAALGAVVGAVAVPFKLLADGFKNLEEQTPAFKEVRTQLADTFSILESVAAKPIFDLVLEQMKLLAGWLKDNKQFVEQLVFSLGQMASVFLNNVVAFAKLDIVKEGFKGLGLIIISTASAMSTLINELTTLIALSDNAANAKTKNVFTSDKGFWGQLKENFNTMTNSDAQKGVIKNFWNNEDKNASATVGAIGALDGKSDGVDHSKGILSESQLKTSQEIMTKYRQELSDLKLDHKKAMDEISEQENRQVINKQTAKDKTVAAVAEERKAIDALVAKYRDLLTTAKDITQLDGSTMRQKTDMLLLGGRGSNAASPYAAGEAETKRATEAADKETMAAKAKSLADQRSLVEKAYASDVALDKKAESEKQVTHAETVRALVALEEERHRQIVALNAQMPDGAVNTPNFLAKQKAAADEQQKYDAQSAASKQAMIQATREDTAATLAYSEAMAKVRITSLQAEDAEAVLIGNKRSHLALTKQIIEAELQLATAEAAAAQKKLSGDTGPAADKDRELLASLYAQIDRLKTQLAGTKYSTDAVGKAQRARDEGAGPTSLDYAGKALGVNFDDLSKDMTNANSVLEKFVIGLGAGITALSGMATAAGQFYDNLKKGGIGSAIGGAASNTHVQDAVASGTQAVGDALGGVKALSSISNAIPMIGPAIGAVMSVVTNLFSQSIQHMVDDINQKVSDINQQAQLKEIGIQQQIKELQAEEQAAIQQLGGKKKAKGQLNTILKSLSSEIKQLQFQAAQTVQLFDDMVKAASLGNMSGVMATWASTWEQINKQVEDYIQAGGSAAVAAQYLNQQLQQQTKQLQDQVNQGNQTAINDALALNKNLQARVDLMKQEAATEFGLINADSAERRTASAVQLGTQLTKQRAQYAQQLLDMNNQITLGQQKVAIESKIFDINQSVASLQAMSNALTIRSLNEQLAKYQDMQSLIKATAGMNFTPGSINPQWGLNGTQAPIPGEPTVTSGPVLNGDININVTANDAASLKDELRRKIRSSHTAFSIFNFN